MGDLFFVHGLPAELLPNVKKTAFCPWGFFRDKSGEKMKVYDTGGMVCPGGKFLSSLCRCWHITMITHVV